MNIDADDTLISLFRRVARANPDREALADSNGTYTYSELDRESDRVAEALHQMGAGREGQRIGLVAYRSRLSVVGLLGILKAGCAYVPLDPAVPPKRRDHIVRESSLAFILDACQEQGAWWRDQSTAAANAVGSAGTFEFGGRERNEPLADHAAYVIYTSGSTGVPKGCEVSHGNVVALLRAALPLFSASDADVWTVMHSLAFDFSVLEVWGAFATAGKAVVVDDATIIEPSALCNLLDKQAVTIVNIVPSAFAAILVAGQRRPAAVRLIIFGGESVLFGALRRFLEEGDWPSADRPQVANMYGITETTVVSTLQWISQDILNGAESRSPIGEPLSHVDLRLFVSPGVEAADGEVGEIYIGGASVSAGYVDRPELTAERFVLLTDSDGTRARYYRSGDLARRGEHGLEYCGRIDHQVKLRGFRIELQEVEAAIAALSGVSMATATVETSRRGLPLLVAYVVPATGYQPGDLQGMVRRDLRQTLPQYMIPSQVVTVDALPTTASGKRDRARLSAIWNERHAAV